MILSFIITIVIENLFHIIIHFTFLLVQVHNDVVILLLLFCMDCLNLLALLSKLSELLDFRSQMSLDIFQFLFNLSDSFGDLLESLILLVIKNFFLVGNTLDLIFYIWISGHSLWSLEILHEFSKILSSALEDCLCSLQYSYFGLYLKQHFLHLFILYTSKQGGSL